MNHNRVNCIPLKSLSSLYLRNRKTGVAHTESRKSLFFRMRGACRVSDSYLNFQRQSSYHKKQNNKIVFILNSFHKNEF